MTSRRMKCIARAACAWLGATVATAPAAGCGVGNPEVNSGGDAARETAAAVELGKDVEDAVSFNDGDRTDWKTFEVPGAGKLVVDVLWGNASARCGFRLVGAAGEEIERFDEIGGDPRKIHRWEVDGPERYFVVFRCEDEGDYSAYLLNVSFTPTAAAPKPPPDDGEPDPEDPSDPPGATGKAPPEEGDVVGEIRTMKKGKRATLLTIDKGTGDGVAVGMTGEIVGLDDALFTVTKVAAKTCTAETLLEAKAIGANLVVRFHKK